MRKTPGRHGKRGIGITALLSAAIAGLVLLSAGVVLALSSQAAWRNTSELLNAQTELAMTLIEEAIRGHVNPALEISRYLHTQVATGQLHPENPGELVAAFKGALAAAPQIAGVVLWDQNIRKMEIRRSANGAVSVSHEQDPVTPELRAFLDTARRKGAPAWGPPTEGDAEANYVYTTTPLNFRGRYWGVIATGVTIGNLSAIVKGIGDQLGLTAFILHQNHVLAHPALDAAPVRLDANNLARLTTIEELGDPVIARFDRSRVLNQPDRENGLELRKIHNPADDETYLALSRDNREFGGIPWRIGVYGRAEPLQKYLRRLFSSVIAGLVVLALAIACALWIARKISRPIRALADSAERIGTLELAGAGGIPPSGIRELDDQAGAFNRMVDGLRWFETYVPKRLVRQLIRGRGHGGGGSALISREAELSVLFTDIIGFTATSEAMPPAAVGAMLNAHFEIVARCIEAEGGTLDKYIGDSVMAFWGAPEDQPDHAQRACRAALAIAHALDEAADGIASEPPVRIKMAIHSGALLVGNIGASSRMNYTVIGDTVNTCSRIESLCGKFDDGARAIILVSSDTIRLARAGADSGFVFEAVGGHEVKGRSGEIHVSRLRPKTAAT